MPRCLGYILIALLALTPSLIAHGADSAAPSAASPNSFLTQDGMAFVPVPGGCFPMGSTTGNSDESPAHEVCLDSFFIGRYEVTQGDWRRIMGYNPSRFRDCGDNCPVEQVSWSDAMEFIHRLNTNAKGKYRLPTEAEWEYACTSGGKKEMYCGGNNLDNLAWHSLNSGMKTHPVGGKSPNALGIFDMSGNVWEWVQDWKGNYPGTRQENPKGPLSSSTRVRRGGSWQYGDEQSRGTWRSSGYPDDNALDIGLRILLMPGK